MSFFIKQNEKNEDWVVFIIPIQVPTF
jgi:hypothetical protein